MSIEVKGGTIYMVVKNDDLTADNTNSPSMNLKFGPKRRTLKWRGRRFNVPTVRVTHFGFVPELTIHLPA